MIYLPQESLAKANFRAEDKLHIDIVHLASTTDITSKSS